MNLVVCMKQVPENPQIGIDQQSGSLKKAEGKPIINPFDMYALEEGLRIKEQYGGKITIICMGPSEAEEALREAFALGMDEAVLLSDPAFEGSDTLATSYVLAKAINRLGQPELIICGRQTADGDTGQVAPQLAEWLGTPFVSFVSKIESIEDGRMTVQRMVDVGHQVIETQLPAVINVVKEINVPRLPSLRGLMQSKKAQIPTWTAQDLDVDVAQVGQAGSPTKVTSVFFPERVTEGRILEGSLERQVDQLAEILREA